MPGEDDSRDGACLADRGRERDPQEEQHDEHETRDVIDHRNCLYAFKVGAGRTTSGVSGGPGHPCRVLTDPFAWCNRLLMRIGRSKTERTPLWGPRSPAWFDWGSSQKSRHVARAGGRSDAGLGTTERGIGSHPLDRPRSGPLAKANQGPRQERDRRRHRSMSPIRGANR